MSRVELAFASHLDAPPERVWRWITSMDGISRELSPILKMTAPRGVTDIADVQVRPGRRLFRSWFLLFGVLPIDRSDLTLFALEPERGFVEQSPMLSMKLWRHERRLEASDGGTLLTDLLSFQPRLGGPLTRWFIRAMFKHRHRVLQRHFGGRLAGGRRSAARPPA